MSFLTTPSAMAALTCTGMISLIPNLFLFLFPNYEGQNSLFLFTGQSVAAGGLLGDVFLHTLPHSMNLEQAGKWILGGFSVFFIVDLVIRSMDGGGGHSHGSHSDPKKEVTHNMNGDKNKHHDPDHSVWWSSTVLLNMSADALHNFTDGVAIGASFSLGQHHDDSNMWDMLQSRGGLAFLSVLFHEVPHELGDYCILVNGGLSKKQAICAQFTTAVAAMIGTVVGLWGAETHSDAMMYMTAGGFVYLATVNILPGVLEETPNKSISFQLAQLCAFAIGIAFMFGVSVLEHHGHDHHNHDHHHHFQHHHHVGHEHDHHDEHHHDVHHHHEHEL